MPIAQPAQTRRTLGRHLGRSRGLRLVLSVAVVGAGFGAAGTPAHASSISWGTVLISGSQWAGGDAGLGDLNVYSNGTGNQDRSGTFGRQYECTELAMRWAHYKYGEPDIWPVSSAADMWNAGPSLPVPMAQEPNGGPVAPEHGDIIVFAATQSDPTGHVAVVSSVTSSSVTFVQQNFTVNGTPSGSWTQPMSGTTVAAFAGLPVLGWLHANQVLPPPHHRLP
ncbi:MAG: CHAP domain-containing protein [Candidatus Dormibacteraeota bacterium]|nr:CHAP domain-containing protein [Candidatus Dormibacteraeota bacterium]